MKRVRRTILLMVFAGVLILIVFLLVMNLNSRNDQQQRYMNFINRLQVEGETVQASNNLADDSKHCFSVSRRLVLLDREEIWVFDYGSSASANVAASQIHPDGYAIGTFWGTCQIEWIAPPHFFKDDSLIVLYVGNQTQILRILTSVLGSQFAGTSG